MTGEEEGPQAGKPDQFTTLVQVRGSEEGGMGMGDTAGGEQTLFEDWKSETGEREDSMMTQLLSLGD